MENNVKWNVEDWTEIQKDELEPVRLSLTICILDDVRRVQIKLLPFIDRVVHIPGSELTDGECEMSRSWQSDPTAAPRQQDEPTSMAMFINSGTI